MKKSPICLSVFLPGIIAHLASQIFLDKEVESCMKPGQVFQGPWSMFPWNSSGKRVQPCLLPTSKWACPSVWGHDFYSLICFGKALPALCHSLPCHLFWRGCEVSLPRACFEAPFEVLWECSSSWSQSQAVAVPTGEMSLVFQSTIPSKAVIPTQPSYGLRGGGVQDRGELQLGAQRPPFRVSWGQIVKLPSAHPDAMYQWASEQLKNQHSCPCFHFKRVLSGKICPSLETKAQVSNAREKARRSWREGRETTLCWGLKGEMGRWQ